MISRNHKTLGKWYFWSYFLAPLFFIFGIILAVLAENPGPNHNNFLLGFYICVGLGIFFAILIVLIEIYAFLAWIKRIF